MTAFFATVTAAYVGLWALVKGWNLLRGLV